MGQKVNPNGLRLGVNKDWQSKWYAEKDYAKLLNNDLKIREFLKEYLKDARAILNNTNTKSSKLILKVLNSATANAVNNLNLKEEELFVSECFINPGPVLKRIKFGSRTKVDRRDKRTSHITVKVSDGKEA